jgi:hypothetical protein
MLSGCGRPVSCPRISMMAGLARAALFDSGDNRRGPEWRRPRIYAGRRGRPCSVRGLRMPSLAGRDYREINAGLGCTGAKAAPAGRRQKMRARRPVRLRLLAVTQLAPGFQRPSPRRPRCGAGFAWGRRRRRGGDAELIRPGDRPATRADRRGPPSSAAATSTDVTRSAATRAVTSTDVTRLSSTRPTIIRCGHLFGCDPADVVIADRERAGRASSGPWPCCGRSR